VHGEFVDLVVAHEVDFVADLVDVVQERLQYILQWWLLLLFRLREGRSLLVLDKCRRYIRVPMFRGSAPASCK
jgi:hypothetical protein